MTTWPDIVPTDEDAKPDASRPIPNTVAALFGHEAALFVPTGTMGNQVAIRSAAGPGDEKVLVQGIPHNRWTCGRTRTSGNRFVAWANQEANRANGIAFALPQGVAGCLGKRGNPERERAITSGGPDGLLISNIRRYAISHVSASSRQTSNPCPRRSC